VSFKEDKACGGVVFRRKDSRIYYLLVKHNPAGHWSLPKGHEEPGETEQQTAKREILEETGLEVDFIPGFRSVVHYFPKALVRKEVVFFLAPTDKKKLQIQKEELSNGVWLELEDALLLATHAGTRDVLKQANYFLVSQTSPLTMVI